MFDEPAAELRFTHDSYDAVSGIVFAAYAGATGRNTEGVYDNVQSVLTAAAPTNLTVSGGYRETTLSWDASANATGYRIYRSESSGSTLSDYTQIADISASTTSYTDTGLEDGERYYYRVTAYANSESDPSGEADAITDLPGPSTPTLDTSTDDEIAVSWTRSDNSGDGDHLIQRSQDNATWTNAGTTSATTTAYTDTGLEDGEQYYYRVRRRTAHATTTSGAATGTTVLPAPSISFDTSTQREITVSWTQTDDNPAGDWELYRSTDGSLGTLVGSWSDLSTTTYTDTGLPDGERYHYTVRRATNHATADTQEAAVTVLPAPTNHQYSTVTAVGADHSWTNNHNNGTVKIQARHDDSGWQDVVSGLDRSTETYTIASLLHGEQYDVRVVAVTEHAQTEDQ
ncbi:fibronectin type III domain-containing protein [Halobacterium sp. KA-6]|uniref:fibronectin type III domain-containing protein n=1 Tax=Halobacterium sp. KA-6 TaxID=2896368 RepID=UPI001E5B4679|nr:fibronectin type III domain-containing protein [Halobacterium sp. KA-6]MCD2204404.1 fibronectin type III domain-containing protein [Halobacterium sp. KA-6]